MDKERIGAAISSLLRARDSGQGVGEFPAGSAPSSIDEAYAIQDGLVETLAREPYGWKVGCTSRLAQAMSNTDEPIFGRMFVDSTFDSPATVPMTDVMAPIVEPEIAFRLSRDLMPDEGPQTAESIVEAVDAMCAAIEVVDCRYARGWPIAIEPTIADNGVHAVFVLGTAAADWRAINRAAVRMHAVVNGEIVTEGIGANALDDPINGLVWLANRFRSRRRTLARGEVVTTGNTANAAIFAKAGDEVIIRFAELGDVELQFV
jgi:2-keto-4-pentenoate hydratase